MRRLHTAARPDHLRRVEAQGLLFHTVAGGRPYWSEEVYYELTRAEVEAVEAASAELHELCLAAAQTVIDGRRFAELGILPAAVPLIERSWEQEPPSLYGRLDLALGPDGVPKLLEYNADTPTSLLESAVIQWTWLSEQFPGRDQFNSIHERLIDTWKDLRPSFSPGLVHFAHVESLEDEMTVGYLRDTAEQAGLSTAAILVEDLGWSAALHDFVDLEGRPIRTLFKLYPWEGLASDPFAPLLDQARGLQWIEPAWKALLSSKGLLPILWELFPGHPNLLPAARELRGLPDAKGWVRKPLHGREGSNVTIEASGVQVATPGPYGAEGFIYQAYTDLGEHEGLRPMVGSWLIGGQPAGLGIRETAGYVTDNTASVVPHVISAGGA